MGLDNIPKNYPCKALGTAVLDSDERIDCKATQSCGGCPWKNANPPEDGRVLGMFGTDCWYRGKYGNYLLEETTAASSMGDDLSFYGDNEDGTEKSPASCVAVADLIATVLVDYTAEEIAEDQEKKETVDGLRYAEWYLRWAAEKCDGLVCWY